MTQRLLSALGRTLLCGTVCAVLGGLACTSPVDQAGVDLGQYNTVPQGFTAAFDEVSGKVTCTWNAPSRPVDFFVLYRGLVGERLATEGARSRIDGSLTSYSDVVGLNNAVYVYELRTAVIQAIDAFPSDEGTLYDTVLVESEGSTPVRCFVGSGISFSINGGDLFTAVDTCRLVMIDRKRELASVEFSAESTLANPQTVSITDSLTSVPWTLKQGGGAKYVWARLHYSSGRLDTLRDDIAIRPYRVEIKLRNDTRKPNETMRVQYARDGSTEYAGKQVDLYHVYRPRVDFSISTFSDSTFSEDFNYCVLFPRSNSRLDTSAAVLASRTINARLTGIGAAHDDQRLYYCGFDPTGKYDTGAVATSSFGLSQLRLLSNYKGTTVTRTDSSSGIAAKFDSLIYMSGDDIYARGKKEFSLAIELTGRHFGDKRIIYSSARLTSAQEFVSYYDAYPPAVQRDKFEFFYPDDGATISGAITVNINQAGSIYDAGGAILADRGMVWDKGGADVSRIELVIAEMPEALVQSWSDATSKAITYQQLMSYRNHVYEFPVGVRDSRVCPVYWNGIDPSSWNTGWYLVALVTEDSFGNRDIAPFGPPRGAGGGVGSNINPQHWRIVTGSVGL